ncbi:hypothetical protein EG68_12624 [Paragonimus skrjabini miyazakii]|uniref:SCP domain-containing protein n=1 Tax=Paragonimus skrjabini miyazakii TaxID=59628 RepID=A0A8S9YC60_9TREM|nr:hypothetical protein EG68_12624 [Paragonimus skrjabini miyazakii]
MCKILEVIILAIVVVEGRITKNERDELLRVHNEIRQSLMNCEYEQFPPVNGYLPRLTWNYTLENMASIHARQACNEYFDDQLLDNFIFREATFGFEIVGQFPE